MFVWAYPERGKTQVELLKLADEYIDEAAEIEAKENGVGPRSPTLWFPNQSPQAPDAESLD